MELTEPLVVPVPESLGAESLARLDLALAAAEERRDAAVWVLRGSPEVFCRGMDFAALAGVDDAYPWLRRFAAVLARLRSAPRPTVAVVDGEVVGGGVGIAAACDWVLATERSRFALPEALFGLLPGVVLPVLLDRMTPQRARLLVLQGVSRSAEGARGEGLVDEVVSAEALEGAARRAARGLSRVSSARVRGLRRWSEEAAHLAATEALTRGAALTAELLGEPSVRAGLERFLESGTPPWEAA